MAPPPTTATRAGTLPTWSTWSDESTRSPSNAKPGAASARGHGTVGGGRVPAGPPADQTHIESVAHPAVPLFFAQLRASCTANAARITRPVSPARTMYVRVLTRRGYRAPVPLTVRGRTHT